MKIKITIILIFTVFVTSSFASDYTCIRRNNGKDFNLNNTSFIMSDEDDTFSCDNRVNEKKIYASNGDDIITGINLSVGTTYFLQDGNDIFSTSPIDYEDRDKYDFQNNVIDGSSGQDIFKINTLYSTQVSISGDCSESCIVYSDYPWFYNIKLISIEKIRFKDKEVTFPKEKFSYTIIPKGIKLMRYDSSNRRPLKFVDTDSDGENDIVAETDVWNIKNASGYIDIYYDKNTNIFYFDTNLSDIIPANSAWTYGDPNIYKGNNPWTGTGVIEKLPIKISNISGLNINFYYKVENNNTPMNFYNEGYITQNKVENNGPQNGDFEIMILWYHFIDMAPGDKIGAEYIPVKVNGIDKNLLFDIYSDNTLGKQTFITFVPVGYNEAEGTLSYDMLDFIKVVKKYHPDIDDMYLEDRHLGNEFGGNVKKAEFRTQIGNYNISLLESNDSSSDESYIYLNFYGNTNLNFCLPFGSDFQFTGGYGYGNFSWKGEVGFDYLKRYCNTCFVPIFKVNGGVGLFSGDGNFGIYYNCNENKTDIINDVCLSINSEIIKSNNVGFGFQFAANWKNMIKFDLKNYITIFRNYVDLYSFYEQYCQKPKFDISLVNLKQIIDKLRETVVSIIEDGKGLPSYVKIDENHSTIIFDFAKNYELKR